MNFRWPAVLWVLALWPLGAVAWSLALRRRAPRAYTHPGVAWVPAAALGFPWWAFAGALLLATLASARPVAPWPVPAKWPVVLVVDVSRSMEETDIHPSRLEAAKRAASEFLRRLPPGVRVGLVTFGNFASVIVPVTADRGRVADAVAQLATQLRTQLGAGLLEAVRLLEQEAEVRSELRGVAVLLSDGRYSDGPTPDEATKRAVQARVRVYTVGIATTRPAHLLRSGYWGLLDEPTLQAIAERTGGRYYRTSSAGELREAYRDLARKVGWRWAQEEVGAVLALASAVLLVVGLTASLRRAPLSV
ncbi:MAG: VWA domain-containing protein [Armatimonadota bacterium]|nr:VWA domain-containing protein [Armatimonadota bacterium]